MIINKLTRPLLLLLLIFSINNIYAENDNSLRKVVIKEIITEIDGATKRKFLLKNMKLETQQEYSSFEDLALYLDEQVRQLRNRRIFTTVQYSLKMIEESEVIDSYELTIKIKDANNTFFIPLAGFSSGSGVKVALKSNFYNIFGTLMDFRISSSLSINKDDARNVWDIPTWNISPSLSGIKLFGLDFSLTLTQLYSTTKSFNFSGQIQQQFTHHSTSLGLGTSITLPLNFSYSISPSISFNYGIMPLEKDYLGNNLPLSSINDVDINFANLTLSHGIGFSNTDWIENFRNGFSAGLSNSNTLSYHLDNKASISVSIGANATYFWRINKYLNLSTRLNAVWTNKEIGFNSYLRGVKGGYLNGYLGAAFSLDLSIKLFDWDGVFEFQAKPFFDIAIVDKKNASFDLLNDFAYTAGLEGILFLDRWSNFKLRGTIGIDLSHFAWNDLKKYEIEMSGSFSY